jgi:hypothetical protein
MECIKMDLTSLDKEMGSIHCASVVYRLFSIVSGGAAKGATFSVVLNFKLCSVSPSSSIASDGSNSLMDYTQHMLALPTHITFTEITCCCWLVFIIKTPCTGTSLRGMTLELSLFLFTLGSNVSALQVSI